MMQCAGNVRVNMREKPVQVGKRGVTIAVWQTKVLVKTTTQTTVHWTIMYVVLTN